MRPFHRREFVNGGIGALGAAAVGYVDFTSPARSRTIKESGRWFAEPGGHESPGPLVGDGGVAAI